MPELPSHRMTFLEALGAMLTTPLGCGGSVAETEDTNADDIVNIADAAEASGPAEVDAGNSSCYSLVPGESPGLKINEILYNPLEDDIEWVELFNKGDQPVNVKNFTLTNREAATLATLPDWFIPPCAYMVVHFGPGTNDDNFAAGAAHFLAGSNIDAFDNSRDEVALYSGNPSADTILDFVAYSGAAEVTEGHAFKHAKEANIWKAGDFFSTSGSAEDPFSMPVIVIPGETIGRDRYSTDTNTSKDWAGIGGKDSLEETAGSLNFTSVTFQDPVAIKKRKKKEWTFLVYMAADNNLQQYGFADLKKFEKVGSGKYLNIVVLADFATIDLAPSINGLQTAAKIYIKKDKKSELELIPEPDTGDQETLSNFLIWAVEMFEAKRYYFLSWGHGGGWKGLAWDDSNGYNRLTMGELADALSNGPKFNIMAFQNCLMASIEVAYQLQKSAEYMVASEEVATVWNWGGWSWDTVLEKISANPNIASDELAKFTVSETEKAYSSFLADLINKGTDPDITTLLNARTISALDLKSANFSELISELSAFAKQLNDGIEDWGKVKTVHDEPKDNVQRRLSSLLQGSSMVDSYPMRKVERPDHRDLYRLAESIQKDGLIADDWKSHAKKVMDMVGKVVIARENGGLHKNATGLSIYFPKAQTYSETGGVSEADISPFDTPLSSGNKDRELYAADDDATAGVDHPLPPAKDFLFPIKTGWGKFLHRFYNPVADASCVRHDAPDNEIGKSSCAAKIGQKVDLRAKGSSDSDGKLKKYYWDFDQATNKDEGDYDRDGKVKDDKDDDLDAEGMKAEYECKVEGEHKLRLMVWDDHYTVNSPTSGDHRKHYQVDTETVTIDCQ